MKLIKTCDFCYKRKRHCDGLGQKYCSFCAATNQAECHYRRRRRAHSTPAHGDDGRSFRRTDSDVAAALAAAAVAEKGGVSNETTGEAKDRRKQGLVLPLKRGRFSASPATGLVGLQENQYLGYFFGCLGFLAITNHSTVRDAMVRIMLAGGSQGRGAGHRKLVGETHGGARQTTVGDVNTNVDGSCRSTASAGRSGTRVLPRDSSTCILWCAIALGALVRGHPLTQVWGYAGLAEDSLRACRDGTTLDTARAYIATAVLHDFLGDRVKTHEYLEMANGIVDGLPPAEIPQGFHGLLQYAGMAWTLDAELASAEEARGYWENACPIWELPQSIGEQDICGLILSVCVRMNQPYVDETGVSRVLYAEEARPRPSTVEPMAHRSFSERAGWDGARSAVGESPAPPSGEGTALEEGQVCLTNIVAFAEVQKSVLPEMLRVQECLGSSDMQLGVGGLLFYGNLSYLQALNDKEAGTSFLRTLDVMLRYPGLCRYKSWLWIVHSHLFVLVFNQNQRKYEQLRASYNSALPPGSKPAPPFEECRSVSDICDQAYCRKTIAHLMYVVNGNRERTSADPGAVT